MKNHLVLLTLLSSFVFLGKGLIAQEDFKRRFSFAKTYFGVDLNIIPGFGNSIFINENGRLETFTRESLTLPAVNIGATHFWGHADFYVSITTVPLGAKDQPVATTTRFGALTGLRIYPWKTKVGTIRPYLGYKFSPIRYRQETTTGTSFQQTNVRGIVDLGVAYQTKHSYFYLGYNRLLNDAISVPISRGTNTQTTLPSDFITVGANWTIETTFTPDREGVSRLNKQFSAENRFGWFVAIGPSSVFPLSRSPYFSGDRRFLDDMTMSNILPDLGVGYHFMPLDANLAIAFRPIVQVRSDGGLEQRVKRNSLVFETYKYLGDYHGFMPFLGVGLGFERIRLEEQEGGNTITEISESTITPILTFGWDIRPNRWADGWLLRTNLRYSPFLNLGCCGQQVNLHQLEFNFIQLVLFPSRIKAAKSNK